MIIVYGFIRLSYVSIYGDRITVYTVTVLDFVYRLPPAHQTFSVYT